MSQPDWELIAELGDADPITYGGYFVYRDRTGVYREEAELLEVDATDEYEEPTAWTVHRFGIDRCTDIGGVLSDNEYHPDYPAWFADDIDAVASCMGYEPAGLRADLCSADPIARARGYQAIGEYNGFDNLDHDPITFTDRAELEARYQTV
jgi:hypothetical protein